MNKNKFETKYLQTQQTEGRLEVGPLLTRRKEGLPPKQQTTQQKTQNRSRQPTQKGKTNTKKKKKKKK